MSSSLEVIGMSRIITEVILLYEAKIDFIKLDLLD